MLLDLSISGLPVIGTSTSGYDEIPRLLGVNPPSKKHGLSISLSWLEKYLDRMPQSPTDEQLMQHLRAYLLYFFGRFLLPDTSGDRVHTMYLSLFEDIDTIRSYSWGSACLALFYRGLCDAATSKKTKPNNFRMCHTSPSMGTFSYQIISTSKSFRTTRQQAIDT
jgi:hypothetical protein